MIRLQVVAGILIDRDSRALISERLGDRLFHGLWEFPGGKIAAGESPEAALARELSEELGIAVQSAEPFMTVEHDYPDRKVNLQFFKVHAWTGEPLGAEGQKLRWVHPGDIEDGLMLPADAPVLAVLRQQ